MRGLMLASGLAAILSLVGRGSAAADDEKTYDLRGPAPVRGQVFVSDTNLKIKNADATLKAMGQKIEVKVTMDIIGVEEQKVLAVDGRNVTKCQSKIVKDRQDILTTLGGNAMSQTDVNALEGEVVISELTKGGKWKHVLVDNSPNKKQQKELDNRNGIENDDDLFPEGKVAVGHGWKVEAKSLTKLFGNSFTDVSGDVRRKFLKVEQYEGQECAVIESTGSVKAKMKDEDGEPNLNVEMELKLMTWRSIKSGVDLKETIVGKIKLSGTQKVDDEKVEITMSGPLSGESTTKVKQ